MLLFLAGHLLGTNCRSWSACHAGGAIDLRALRSVLPNKRGSEPAVLRIRESIGGIGKLAGFPDPGCAWHLVLGTPASRGRTIIAQSRVRAVS